MATLAYKIVRHFREKPRHLGLTEFVDRFWANLPQSAMFGGIVRDFALAAPNRLRSDIDIVTMAGSDDIRRALAGVDLTLNKYGGFRFYVGHRLFDVWSLRDTWAVREGHVGASDLQDLCNTTFFNIDAALFDYGTGKLVTATEFETALRSHILDINLLANPDPKGMARRAIRMALSRNLALSPRLVLFVVSQLDRGTLRDTPGTFGDRLLKHAHEMTDQPFRYWDQLNLWPDYGTAGRKQRADALGFL